MTNLAATLNNIDWKKNIKAVLSDGQDSATLERVIYRLAVWAKQFEIADLGNPALCFSREAQIAMQQGAATVSLCLYKSSAAAARTVVESCLYYSFFRSHLEELATLVRNPKFYVKKSEIVDYHKLHSPGFFQDQALFGLSGRLDAWYSKTSAIVHSQVPGVWSTHSMLSDIGYDKKVAGFAIKLLSEGEELVHHLFLCTIGKQLWSSFSPDAKTFLLKGLPGEKREALGLDSK